MRRLGIEIGMVVALERIQPPQLGVEVFGARRPLSTWGLRLYAEG